MNRFVTACLAVLLLPGLASAADVPVRVRIIQGSRQGPATLDPRLADLQKQLGKLAYQKWVQLDEQQLSMVEKKTQFVKLPDGTQVALTVQEVRGDTVTFEVSLAQRNTQSRVTIDKEKRIVHQVTGEKNGVAYFVTVRAWP
jgi:hypothetical protein